LSWLDASRDADGLTTADCYAQADTIRKEILSRPLRAVNLAIAEFPAEIAKTKSIQQSRELLTKNYENRGGIMTSRTVTQVNELLKILNGKWVIHVRVWEMTDGFSAELVFAWRKKLIQLLSSPIESEAVNVSPDIEDPDAEYYAEVLKAQGDSE
jgi:E3 ubiquitin-protein ligase SHPRH